MGVSLSLMAVMKCWAKKSRLTADFYPADTNSVQCSYRKHNTGRGRAREGVRDECVSLRKVLRKKKRAVTAVFF